MTDDIFADSRKEEDKQEERDNIFFDLTPYNFTIDVYGLIRRYFENSILIPSFQRNYVWEKNGASMFIDSILRGLPSPSLFFYEEERQKYLVIDGQQRLLTLFYFISGKFPINKKHQNLIIDTEKKATNINKIESKISDEDIIKKIREADIDGTSFTLTGKVHKNWYGKTFTDLSQDEQNLILNTYVYVVNLKQTVPKDDNTSMFLIFERINTGSRPLNAQQVRLCVSHGKFSQLLVELATDEKWWEIFKLNDNDGLVSELILRFFALLYTEDEFKNSIRVFLDMFLKSNRHCNIISDKELTDVFTKSFDIMCNNFTYKDFAPKKKLYGYVLIVIWIAVSKNMDRHLSKDSYSEFIQRLKTDEEFITFRDDTRRAANPQILFKIIKHVDSVLKNIF